MRNAEIALLERADRPGHLTSREAEVLGWVAEGLTNAEVARILRLSPRTIQKHLEHVYEKLGVATRTAASARLWRVAANSASPPEPC